MIRRLVLPFGLMAVFAVPAPVFAGTNHYRAELAAPAPTQRFIVRDLIWSCTGASCDATQTTSRAAIDCAALADKVGAVRSFSVAGQPLPADTLEKCNAKAR